MLRLSNSIIVLFSILALLAELSLSAALAQNCVRDPIIGGCSPPPPPITCVREHTCVIIDDGPCPIASACTNDTVCCSDTQTCTNNTCVDDPCLSACTWGGPCCEPPLYCKGTACISPCLGGQEHVGPNGTGTCCPTDMMCGNACCGGDAAESYEYGCASAEWSLCCVTGDYAAPVYVGGAISHYMCCPVGYCGSVAGCYQKPVWGCD